MTIYNDIVLNDMKYIMQYPYLLVLQDGTFLVLKISNFQDVSTLTTGVLPTPNRGGRSRLIPS